MAEPDPIPIVCFLDDVARVLRTSRRNIQRMRAARVFPMSNGWTPARRERQAEAIK